MPASFALSARAIKTRRSFPRVSCSDHTFAIILMLMRNNSVLVSVLQDNELCDIYDIEVLNRSDVRDLIVHKFDGVPQFSQSIHIMHICNPRKQESLFSFLPTLRISGIHDKNYVDLVWVVSILDLFLNRRQSHL